MGEVSDGCFANSFAVAFGVSEEDCCGTELAIEGFDVVGHAIILLWERNHIFRGQKWESSPFWQDFKEYWVCEVQFKNEFVEVNNEITVGTMVICSR